MLLEHLHTLDKPENCRLTKSSELQAPSDASLQSPYFANCHSNEHDKQIVANIFSFPALEFDSYTSTL